MGQHMTNRAACSQETHSIIFTPFSFERAIRQVCSVEDLCGNSPNVWMAFSEFWMYVSHSVLFTWTSDSPQHMQNRAPVFLKPTSDSLCGQG